MAATDTLTWVASGLAAASVPLHGWMLAAHDHGIALSVAMGAMALWCLWCAVGAVRRGAPDGRAGCGVQRGVQRGTVGRASMVRPCPRVRSLRHLWVMAGVMALLHVALLTGAPGGGHGAHGTPSTHNAHATHGAAPVQAAEAAAGAGAGSGTGLMLAIVVLELAVCFACAGALRTRSARGMAQEMVRGGPRSPAAPSATATVR